MDENEKKIVSPGKVTISIEEYRVLIEERVRALCEKDAYSSKYLAEWSAHEALKNKVSEYEKKLARVSAFLKERDLADAFANFCEEQ